jgi:hypothetical protein
VMEIAWRKFCFRTSKTRTEIFCRFPKRLLYFGILRCIVRLFCYQLFKGACCLYLQDRRVSRHHTTDDSNLHSHQHKHFKYSRSCASCSTILLERLIVA